MRKALFLFVLISGLFAFAGLASAQDSGGQDSTGSGLPPLRARRDAYIIVPFPSPALRGVTMNIQMYNQNSGQFSLRIVDINDKTVKELLPPTSLDNGLHSYPFNTGIVSNGTYFIRLTTYSTTGSLSQVQDTRFIVLH